ncbi:MAG: LacI family DNA-binding transcriptional regulator [Natronospirillum sp.]|uniref:LacI family DNA-binding transcriptional regulator n=1 Tax=Natronospirillum sp. TaxID=2812955 RepID=UPI0025EF907A|nr:LacI family DNA-binding transcriptional regulator [Natronospirillum sp.]MCH8553078.1 LacI family DNA-binding transcriptional regulator [Natronospirillum sp.]
MTSKTGASVSMADIARLAGVSESTVSRALNNNPAINVDTRERIHQIAHKLNYRMNMGARNLRLRRTHTVAVVINTEIQTGQSFTDPFMMDMVSMIADELNRSGYSLLFASTSLNRKDWHTHLIASRRADGIIIIGAGKYDLPIKNLYASGDPLVVWGSTRDKAPYCVVGSDNVQGGRLATEYLLKQGRTRIAFLGDTRHPEVRDRHQGYTDALTEAGLAPVNEKLLLKSFRYDSAQERLETTLRQIESLPFDGLVAASDMVAMGSIKALQNCGYRVPDDVSVVGYDDIPMANVFTPALTTVRQDIERGAKLLVKKILTQIKEQKANSTTLPVRLVRRES